MMTLESIQNRARQILADADGNRYDSNLLENATRLTMQGINEKLPRVLRLDHAVITSGRDQSISSLEKPLFLMQVILQPMNGKSELEFSYALQNETAYLHFSGIAVPTAGQTLRLVYAAQHTLNGLDGAAATSLADGFESALSVGTAGFACLLRASFLAETYGVKQGEPARLVEQSRAWLEHFHQALVSFKPDQQPEYPEGFALDRWDRQGEFT